MAAGSVAVLTSFLTNLYIFLGLFGAFSVLRVRPWARRFFAARRYAKDIDLRPKRLGNGLLSWILPVAFYPESDIIDEAGLDAAMYLRILRFGIYQFLGLSFFCIVAVLPTNLTSNAIDQLLADQAAGKDNSSMVVNGNEYKFTDFDKYSLSNIPLRSDKMWVHLIAVYVVTAYTLWLLWRFNKESVILRLLFLGNSKRGGPSHTVLVTDIPGVGEAVADVLRSERSRKLDEAREKSKVSINLDDVKVQADSTYVELQGAPPPASDTPADGPLRKGKAVSFVGHPPPAKPVLPTSTLASNGEAADGAKGGDARPSVTFSEHAGAGTPPALQSVDAKAGGPPPAHNGSVEPRPSHLNTPFASPQANTLATAPSGEVEGNTPPAANSGRSFFARSFSKGRSFFARSLKSVVKSSASASSYRLEDDSMDPRYAATGGKLLPPRLGKTKSEILEELEVVDPEDVLKALPPAYGVDTRPLPPDRRNTKRYQYDMTTGVLDPDTTARKILMAGATPQQMVAREFAMVYQPYNVAAVNMIPDTSQLEPLAAEYNKIAMQLEDYLEMAKLRLKLRKGLPQKQLTVLRASYKGFTYLDKFPGKWFVKVDAVEFWLERLRFLRERIREEQPIAARKAAPSAFVTFNTRMAQAVGSNSLHAHDETRWRVQTAPAPFEVVWKNLGMSFTIKSGRLYILWAAFWAMTLFFMVPVSAIQALIEVPKLAKMPVLGPIVRAPVIKQLLEAIVPGLVLKIFLAIVPIILRIMAHLSGSTSISEIDFGVVQRYFLFQVIVVFFGSIIAGSFFNQISQWVDDPGSVIPTLGKSVPMTSTFFITYLFVNGMFVKSMAFIRLPAFIIFWILSKFAGSPRARQRMWMYQYINNGTTVVDHTIALLIGTTFSCINPIVCLAALVYFLVNFLGESYNNIYVFRREYESAGRLWQTVYNQIMTALYVMQIVMLALLIIKKFGYALLIIPLIVITFGSHFSTLTLYSRPWSVTSLHDAAMMDMVEADERRMNLLASAREERKKKRDKIKRAYDEVVRRAEAAGDPIPPPPPELNETPAPGKSENLLMETLEGDGFAINSEEKKEIAEMYLNPVFKVRLEDIERLAKLAAEVQSRLPRLNAWVVEYRRYRREVKRRQVVGDTELVPPPKMPEDLTIFDEDPNLVDSDVEEDKLSKASSFDGEGDEQPAALARPSQTKSRLKSKSKDAAPTKGDNRV